MQAGKRYAREVYLPDELTSRLSAIEITLSKPEKMEIVPDGGELVRPPKTRKKEDHKIPEAKSRPAIPSLRLLYRSLKQ